MHYQIYSGLYKTALTNMKSSKVILDLQSFEWLLSTQHGDWTIPFPSDAAGLAGFIPLVISNDLAPEKKPAILGKAYLHSTEGSVCTVELLAHDKERIFAEIEFCLDDIEDKGKIDFFEGFYSDGWLATDTFAALTNIEALGLRFSIPAHENAGNKTVIFQIDDELIEVRDIERDTIQEVWLNLEKSILQNELKIKSAYSEPDIPDERDLGIQIKELNVNLTNWESFETFYNIQNHD